MNTIEIMCEACDAKMRLSGGLLDRLEGRRGRVTCKQCSNKVSLDASGDEVVVTAGGTRVESGDFELEPISENDPHLSDLPPAQPSLGQISLAKGSASSLPPPLPKSAASQEAPLPPMRGVEDSLSPHTFEDEASLAALARDIRSTPFAAPPPRDESYQSLYPEMPAPAMKPQTSSSFGVSKAPSPPRASSRASAPAPVFSEDAIVGVAPGVPSVLVTQDGRLLNQADLGLVEPKSKSSKAPWILAAVALFALGVSLSAQLQNGVSDAFRPQISSAAASPSQPAAAEQSKPSETTVPDVMIDAAAPGTEAEELDSTGELDSTDKSVARSDTATATKSKDSTPKKASVAAQAAKPTSAPVATTPAAPTAQIANPGSSSAEAEAEPEVQAAPFSAAQAAGAMREATALASSCRRPSDPSGQARVVVTFAPSGRVTRATISGPPFAGTTTGGCIASRFRGARISAFSGEAVTVSKTVTVH